MVLMRRKRLPDGSFGKLEKVFEGETQEEVIERLEGEADNLKALNLNVMLALTEMYEEQYQRNLDLMLAMTDLYEMIIKEEE